MGVAGGILGGESRRAGVGGGGISKTLIDGSGGINVDDPEGKNATPSLRSSNSICRNVLKISTDRRKHGSPRGRSGNRPRHPRGPLGGAQVRLITELRSFCKDVSRI